MQQEGWIQSVSQTLKFFDEETTHSKEEMLAKARSTIDIDWPTPWPTRGQIRNLAMETFPEKLDASLLPNKELDEPIDDAMLEDIGLAIWKQKQDPLEEFRQQLRDTDDPAAIVDTVIGILNEATVNTALLEWVFDRAGAPPNCSKQDGVKAVAAMLLERTKKSKIQKRPRQEENEEEEEAERAEKQAKADQDCIELFALLREQCRPPQQEQAPEQAPAQLHVTHMDHLKQMATQKQAEKDLTDTSQIRRELELLLLRGNYIQYCKTDHKSMTFVAHQLGFKVTSHSGITQAKRIYELIVVYGMYKLRHVWPTKPVLAKLKQLAHTDILTHLLSNQEEKDWWKAGQEVPRQIAVENAAGQAVAAIDPKWLLGQD
jgi:hypothetical protein